jgi:hypothetical protein
MIPYFYCSLLRARAVLESLSAFWPRLWLPSTVRLKPHLLAVPHRLHEHGVIGIRPGALDARPVIVIFALGHILGVWVMDRERWK